MRLTREDDMKQISDEKVTEIAKLANVSTDTVERWIYADWDNGDEHEEWITTAPASEIAAWIDHNIVVGGPL
jgi:hypothetical protein